MSRFAPPRWLSLAVLIGLAVVVLFGAYRVVTEDRAAHVPPGAAVIDPEPSIAPALSHTSVFFGDALVAGANAGEGNPTFTAVAARQLGWEQVPFGFAGTGFTTAGIYRGGREYLARIQQLRGYESDVIVIEGGINDTKADSDTLRSKAGAVLDAAHSLVPAAQLVVMGPYSRTGTPNAELTRVNGVLKDLASARGIPYVDPIGEHWITGFYPKTSNAKDYLAVGGVYPNTAGHAYFGKLLAADLKRLLPARLLS